MAATSRVRFKTVSGALVAAAALLAAAPTPAAGLATPTPSSPAHDAAVQALPAFAWNAVAGAARYEFQIAADSGFNSPVLGRGEDQFFTRNTRATLKKTFPNGTYYWRVRAVDAQGQVSPWSAPRPLRKGWTAAPALQAPAHGAVVAHPSSPLVLRWSAVPYAAKYLVTIASDPMLGSAVGGQQNVETAGTVYAPRALLLPPGTYYWGVTPLDAQGHRGVPSPVASFTWTWPTTTAPTVTDLMAEPEVFDPFFSWNTVPGAAKYELEVNPTEDFSPGSKVCCTGPITGTSHSPTFMLRDNTYHWRVRALDAFGNAGAWNVGAPFTKTFDKVPPVSGPSIKNLHMRDNLVDPGSDLQSGTAGYQTQVPIVTWNPVPGASSYEVDVFPFEGGICDWSDSDLPNDHWRITTATTAWTPLGNLFANKPYPDAHLVANDGTRELVAGKSYCVRVRARADRDSSMAEVYGDYTYLNDGTGVSFTWLGYPTGGACTPSCNANYLGSGDYLLPTTGTSTTRMPLFTWKPLAGKASYWVIVAKDPAFSNIVDYAFTEVPAYAPRTMNSPETYPDEETLYYWAVLPATDADGDGAVGNPLDAAARSFQKLSAPPTLVSPTSSADVAGQTTFRWTAAEATRRYRLQVSQDPSFGTLLEDVTTASTAYTTATAYPADTILYWRVRADDENGVGLRWSQVGTFQRRLPVPAPKFDMSSGDMFPLISWNPLEGAVSYRIAVDEADGERYEYDDFRSAAAAFVKMTGTGVTGIRVRANFPTKTTQTTPGPWSPTIHFTRTMGEPTGAATDATPDSLLFRWDPKPGAKQYRVLVSNREDFSLPLEDVTTDNSSYASPLTHTSYLQGGTFYWRVAAIDDDRNVGDFTRAHSFTLRRTAGTTNPVVVTQRLRVGAKGRLRARRFARIVITVKAGGRPVARAKVRGMGAGLLTRYRSTNRRGQVVFRVKPKRRGFVLFQATKARYIAGAVQVRVR
jgi:large repetitive protein